MTSQPAEKGFWGSLQTMLLLRCACLWPSCFTKPLYGGWSGLSFWTSILVLIASVFFLVIFFINYQKTSLAKRRSGFTLLTVLLFALVWHSLTFNYSYSILSIPNVAPMLLKHKKLYVHKLCSNSKNIEWETFMPIYIQQTSSVLADTNYFSSSIKSTFLSRRHKDLGVVYFSHSSIISQQQWVRDISSSSNDNYYLFIFCFIYHYSF